MEPPDEGQKRYVAHPWDRWLHRGGKQPELTVVDGGLAEGAGREDRLEAKRNLRVLSAIEPAAPTEDAKETGEIFGRLAEVGPPLDEEGLELVSEVPSVFEGRPLAGRYDRFYRRLRLPSDQDRPA